MDTEDELRKFEEKKKKKEEPKGASGAGDSVYDAPTDEDVSDDNDDGGELPELPDFFSGKTFFMYGKWDAGERRKVKRYLIAYNG